MKNSKGILFVVNTLEPGGAEIFILRLAKYLRQHFQCYVITSDNNRNDTNFTSYFIEESGAKLLPQYKGLPRKLEYLFWKLNASLGLFGMSNVFERLSEWHRKRYWTRLFEINQIVLVNSHLFASDLFVLRELRTAVPDFSWVVSTHSSYNADVIQKHSPEYVGKFMEQAKSIFSEAQKVICVAEINKELPSTLGFESKVEKIYLGLETKSTRTLEPKENDSDRFVFVMIGRGFEGKGWKIALNAFEKLKQKYANIELICVGPETEYMQALKSAFEHVEDITFTGYVTDTAPYISQAKVGLLPSFGESLPYSIIEFLGQNKPVIASDRGEIPLMLTTDSGVAGAVLSDGEDGLPSEIDLIQKMEMYILDNALLLQHQKQAKIAFQKFSMDHCGGRYLRIFNDLIAENG